MNSTRSRSEREGHRFLTTQWTNVLSARGDSDQARASLKVLCDRYYAPVHLFVQTYTHYDQNALDWTHSFFAKLLEGRSLDTVLPSRGRFRSYLLGAVKNFLADERAKQRAVKRGGSISHQGIDQIEESLLSETSSHEPDLDTYFDRQWALSILQISLEDLESELDPLQRSRFELLRPWLSGDPSELTQEQVSEKLEVSVDTVKVTIHRWRKRFREIVKSHVASTLSDADDVEEELRYLVQVLATV